MNRERAAMLRETLLLLCIIAVAGVLLWIATTINARPSTPDDSTDYSNATTNTASNVAYAVGNVAS